MATNGGGDWVLVTKKRGRKTPSQRPQSTTRSTGHGHSTQQRKSHGHSLAAEPIDTNARVSRDKQRAIQARVDRISATLQRTSSGEASPLVASALRAIAGHVGLESSEKGDEEVADASEPRDLHIVSYGLGSFCSSSNAVHQLAFVHALVQAAKQQYGQDSLKTTLEIFDPVMNASDREIAQALGITTIDQNECGHRVAATPTVFYMPHCGHALYQNVVVANYAAATLDNVLIIGNSFEAYSDRLIDASARKASVLLGVLPFVTETPLPVGIPASHDDFPLYEAAFNDMSIHSFSPAQAQAALASSALQTLIQATVDAAASVAPASGSVLSTAIDRELLV